MKLSEQLKQDHECGDFGKAIEGYSEIAKSIENRAIDLERKLEQAIDLLDIEQRSLLLRIWTDDSVVHVDDL